MKKSIAIFSLFILCMPFITLAHPGHGETGGFTITHYFTEPVHILVSVSVLLIAFVGLRFMNRKGQQKGNS